MRRSEIEALLRVHRNRAAPVAFYHILRQPKLQQDDHAFLAEHITQLTSIDLLRWRPHCDQQQAQPLLERLAQQAIDEPKSFENDILRLPSTTLGRQDWQWLADKTEGRIEAHLQAELAQRAAEESPREAAAEPASVQQHNGDDDAHEDFDLSSLLNDAELAGSWEELAEPPELWRQLLSEPANESLVEQFTQLSGDEQAALLSWLQSEGMSRDALMALAMQAFTDRTPTSTLLHWLTGQLNTRAAWEKQGAEVLSALLDKHAWSELQELFALCWSSEGHAQGQATPTERRTSLEKAIHEAFAVTLLTASELAIQRDEQAQAAALLSALACLDPPSRVSRYLRKVRHIARDRMGSEVASLLSVNERLIKHGSGRDASLEGAVAAVGVLADALR